MVRERKKCIIKGCNNKQLARQWCCKHYNKWVKYKDPIFTKYNHAELCIVTGCNKKFHAKGYCMIHYIRFYTHGNPNICLRNNEHSDICKVLNCYKPYYGNGYCEMHNWRRRKYGNPLIVKLIRDPNRICKKCKKRKHYSKGMCENCYRKVTRTRPQMNLYNMKVKAKNKVKLMTILGKKCIICGNTNPFHLQFDHINDDGQIDRRRYKSSYTMVNAYLNGKENIKKLQLLCANCNYEKQYRKNNIWVEYLMSIYDK